MTTIPKRIIQDRVAQSARAAMNELIIQVKEVIGLTVLRDRIIPGAVKIDLTE